MRAALLTLIVVAICATTAPLIAAADLSFGRDSVVLTGQPAQRSFFLGKRNLFRSTDSLVAHGRLLSRDDQYAIDYVRGEVYFAVPLAAGDTVVAWFKALAVDLPEAVTYLPVITGSSTAAASDSADAAVSRPGLLVMARDSQELAPATGSQVRFGGNKTFSIAAGSGRDLSLDQALNVNADGRLSPDLEISASLSDRSLPLTQAGTTEELSQLDRMFIQARASSWSMTLGDIDLSYDELSLLRLNRQLEGVQAGGRLARAQFNGAYSLSKGKTEVNRFAGQEGKQGPYQLTVSDGAQDFGIVANSQKVWLNGDPLQPGASNDYTMDYDRAELTFTPRRPINRDSRVVVEFQFTAGGYRRSLYFASARVPAGEHVTLRAAYLQESDDADRPSGEALSDSQRAAISRAGSDTALLWVDGGTLVDSGNGSYARQDSFYVFVGPGRGNYSVSFISIGQGLGEYAFDNVLGGFRYVGAGHGDYMARRRLVSPQSISVANVRTDVLWAGGAAFLEASGSQMNPNTLADTRAISNTGTASRAQASWKRDSLAWGGFELRSDFSNITHGYYNVNRAREPGFEAAWGLNNWSGIKQADPLAPHQALDLGAVYRLFSLAEIGGRWGRLGFDDGRWARIYQLTTGLTLPGLPQLRYQRLRYLLGNFWTAAGAGSGQRDLHQLTTVWSGGPWRLNGGYSNERDLVDLGQSAGYGTKYWETSLGWMRSTAAVNFGQTLQRRDDGRRDSLTQTWAGQSYTTTVTSLFRISRPQSLNVALDHTFRQTRLRPGAVGSGLRSHLAALHADGNGWGGMVRASLDYTLSAVTATQQQERYYRVPDRSGDYGYDPVSGTFYPDTAGNYRRTMVDLAQQRPATENTAKGFISIAPAAVTGIWQGVRLECAVSAAIKSPDAVDVKQLMFQRDRLWRGTNLSALLDLAGDLSYTAAGWNGKLHLRWKHDSDNQSLGRHLDTRLLERRGDLYLPLPQQWRAALFAEINSAAVASAENGRESGTATVRGGVDAGVQLDPSLELAGKADAVRERLERFVANPLATAVAFTAVTVTPYLTRQLGMAGRVRAEAGLIERSADHARDEIPAEFAVTRPLGLTKTWALQYDYRINTVLTTSAGYDGRKEPDQRPVHNARFELRAYF